jgi:hypothetical protein
VTFHVTEVACEKVILTLILTEISENIEFYHLKASAVMLACLHVFACVSLKSTTHETAFLKVSSLESVSKTVKSMFEIW